MASPNKPNSASRAPSGVSSYLTSATRARNLLYATMAAATFNAVGCGDSPGEPPARGSVCVTVLDQEDKARSDCEFDYKVSKAALGEDVAYDKTHIEENEAANPDQMRYNSEACEEGQLLIYGAPGKYKVEAKCDNNKQAGYVEVDLEEGENNDEQQSRLVESFCSSNAELIADPQHPIIELQSELGYSDDKRCVDGLTDPQAQKMVIDELSLECEGVTGDCHPNDAEDLVEVMGTPGQFIDKGQAMNLMLETNPRLIPNGEERIVNVTLKQTGGNKQELSVPILIKGPKCGNDIVEFGEKCEASQIPGSCEDHGFDEGELECDETCQISTANCSKTEKAE